MEQGVCIFAFMRGLFVLAFMSVTFAPTVADADAHASLPPPAEIISVFPKHFPPYHILDKKGKPSGFAIEVLEAVAKRSGLKIKHMPKETWMMAYQAFRADQAQIIPNLGITKERKQDADFTVPMDALRVSIFVRFSDTRFKVHEDLNAFTIGVRENNAGVKLAQNFKDANVKVFKTLPDLLSALNNKTVDAIIYPETVINTHVARSQTSKRIKSVGSPLQIIQRAIAVRKGNPELLALLNWELKAFIKTQAFDEIHRKWFNVAITRTSFMSRYWWIGYALFAFLVVTAGLLYWVPSTQKDVN